MELTGKICIFAAMGERLNRPPKTPCEGGMTRHHVQFKSEAGPDTDDNLVPMCEGHQRWVHSSDTWGGEDFSSLAKDARKQKKGRQRFAYNRQEFKRGIYGY